MSKVVQSRHLPRRHEQFLKKVEASPGIFDGGSEKTVGTLVEYDFVKIKTRDEKNPRRVTVEISERGKTALERNRRGVDPYLVMTE